MSVFQNLILGLNRLRNRLHTGRVRPENLLLLIPHCLQRCTCESNIAQDVDPCNHCGQCNVADMLQLCDEFGIRCHLVSGGREAIVVVRDPAIKAVVAVACEKELADGIRAVIPKRVIAIPNERPNGPCKNTRVNTAAVRAAIRELLGSPA